MPTATPVSAGLRLNPGLRGGSMTTETPNYNHFVPTQKGVAVRTTAAYCLLYGLQLCNTR
jgi:hypothetical protein